jgi:hypothetical protein
VVEHVRRDRRVEPLARVELFDRRSPEDRPLRCLRIDREHLVAGDVQRSREIASPAADLEHSRRRRRQGGDDEGDAIHLLDHRLSRLTVLPRIRVAPTSP